MKLRQSCFYFNESMTIVKKCFLFLQSPCSLAANSFNLVSGTDLIVGVSIWPAFVTGKFCLKTAHTWHKTYRTIHFKCSFENGSSMYFREKSTSFHVFRIYFLSISLLLYFVWYVDIIFCMTLLNLLFDSQCSDLF